MWPVAVAVLLITVMALVDPVLPTSLVLLRIFAVGPCLATAAARPRAVTAVGGYALLLVAANSRRHGLLATPEGVLSLAAVAVVTAVSVIVAYRLRIVLQAAAQDRAARDRLATVLDTSDEAIVIESLDGTIQDWNNGAQRMYGYPRQEAIGQHISLVMPSAEASALPGLLDRVAQGEHIGYYEAQRVAKDGTVLEVSINLVPVRDSNGRVVAASAIARDITARKHAEALAHQLQQRSAQNERLESLGQLAGGVAHDFNNMLAVILNYTEFLTETVGSNPDATADLDRIRGAAQRSQALVRQLLVFARREPTRIEDLDLTTLIIAARDLLVRSIGENIELITKTPAQPLHVRADRGQIEQVLLNLVLNARDAMPDGGTLVIEAAPTDIDTDQRDLQLPLPPGRYACLLVSDTGTGMSSDVAARVFEPFFTTKPKDKGVGLGLATAYGVITDADGAIQVYTEPGVGTTMRVYLPAIDQPAATPTTPTNEQPPHGHGQRVLVVEDEDAVRDMVTRILQHHGYTVLAADRGPIALDLVGDHPPDLLLTDVIMPEMSGRDLAHRMRQHHPHLPVIFMSGYSDGILTAQHILQADTPLIQKPFTAGELLHTIHRVLNTAPSPTTTSPRPNRR